MDYWDAHINLIDSLAGYHPDIVMEDYLLYSNKKNDINNHMNYYYMRYHPNFTNYTSTFKETIDYIFYSNSLRKVKIGSFPSEDEIHSFLPDEVYPSDHLKLFAQFAYKSKMT